jgi:dihydrofolate reductase
LYRPAICDVATIGFRDVDTIGFRGHEKEDASVRKLKLQMQTSLDGFVASQNGQLDFMVWDWDDDLNHYVDEITEPVDLLPLGRVLAEGFIPTWKSRLEADPNDASARKFVETPKIVFTRTLSESPWENTTLAKGDLAQEVTRMKEADGGDIIAYGGGTFVSDLIRNNLIDEYNFFVNPAAISEGMTIFRQPGEKVRLKLENSKGFECGIVGLRYTPVA